MDIMLQLKMADIKAKGPKSPMEGK